MDINQGMAGEQIKPIETAGSSSDNGVNNFHWSIGRGKNILQFDPCSARNAGPILHRVREGTVSIKMNQHIVPGAQDLLLLGQRVGLAGRVGAGKRDNVRCTIRIVRPWETSSCCAPKVTESITVPAEVKSVILSPPVLSLKLAWLAPLEVPLSASNFWKRSAEAPINESAGIRD